MTATITKEQVQAALKIMFAVADTIREAGRVAEGTLYATLMDRMDHNAFESMIRQIVNTGCVKRERNELVWVG